MGLAGSGSAQPCVDSHERARDARRQAGSEKSAGDLRKRRPLHRQLAKLRRLEAAGFNAFRTLRDRGNRDPSPRFLPERDLHVLSRKLEYLGHVVSDLDGEGLAKMRVVAEADQVQLE